MFVARLSFLILYLFFAFAYAQQADYSTSAPDTLDESFETSNLSNIGWSELVNTTGSGYIETRFDSFLARTGSRSARLYNGNDENAEILLVSPRLNQSQDGRLYFYARKYSLEDVSLEVGTLADSTDYTSFTPLKEVELGNDYKIVFVPIDADSDEFIAFRHANTSINTFIHIDDVNFRPMPALSELIIAETNVQFPATAVNYSSSLDVTIANGGSADLNIAGITDAGFFSSDFSGVIASGETQTIQLFFNPTAAGNNAETLVVEVNGEHAGQTNAIYAEGISYEVFTDLAEGFESGSTLPPGWQTHINASSLDARVRIYSSSSYAFNGFGSVEFYNHSDADAQLTLISPVVESIAGRRLTFWARHRSSGITQYLSVGTINSATDIDSYSPLDTLAITGEYKHYSINFSDADADHFALRRMNPEDQNYTYISLHVDELAWQATPDEGELFLYDTTHTFLDTHPGQATVFQLPVMNTGGAQLDITGVTPNGPFSSDFSGVLQPGQTALANIYFSPSDTGQFAADLIFNSAGETGGNNTIALSGFAYPASNYYLENFDDAFAFNRWLQLVGPDSESGNVFVTSSGAPHSPPNHIYLSNFAESDIDLMLIAPAVTGFAGNRFVFWSAAETGDSVAVGLMGNTMDPASFVATEVFALASDYQRFAVLFSDSSAGVIPALKFMPSNSYNNMAVDDVAWEPLPQSAEILLSAAELNFGFAGISTSAALPVTIFNTGTVALNVSDILLSAPFYTDFSGTVEAGASAEFEVVFRPGADSVYTDTLTINISGEFLGENRIALTGEGYSKYATMSEGFEESSSLPEYWGIVDNNGGYLQIYSSSGFANSGDRSLRFYNYENTPDNDLAVVLPAFTDMDANRLVFHARTRYDYDVASVIAGTVPEPGSLENFTPLDTFVLSEEYERFILTFTDTTEAYIVLKHGLIGTYDYIYLDDFYWETNPVEPEISLSDTTLSFTPIPVFESIDLDFIITNTGNSTLNISSVSSSAPFESTFSGTIEPGASELLTVTFAPTDTGSYTDELILNVDGVFLGRNIINLAATAYPAFKEFSEGFEHSGAFPGGWETLITDPDGGHFISPYGSSSYAHTGDYSIEMYNSSTDSSGIFLISPAVADLDSNRIVFYANHREGVNDTLALRVGTLNEIETGESFIELAEVGLTREYQRFVINSTSSKRFKDQLLAMRKEGAPTYLAFKHSQETTSDNYHLDDVSWEKKPVVPEIFITDSTLNFPTTVTDGEYTLEVKLENTGLNPLEITGVEVAAPFFCDFSGAVSSGESAIATIRFAPSEAGTFETTLRFVINGDYIGANRIYLTGNAYAPMSEFAYDFENNGAFPDGWSWLNADADNSSYVQIYSNSSYANSGIYSVEMNNSAVSDAGLFLFSPAVANVDSNRLVFWGRHREGSGDTLDLQIGLVDEVTEIAAFIPIQTVRLTQSYQRYTVPTGSIEKIRDFKTGERSYLAFKHGQNSSNDNYHLDDIIWEKQPLTAEVLVSDTLITFLDTPENGEDRFTVTVTNTGLEPLEVTGASIDLPFYCDFNGTINSGASAEMVVYFRPQNSGSFAATLTLDIVGTFAGDNSIEVNGAAYAPVASFNQGFEDSDGRMPVRWSGLISNGSPLHKVSVYNSASYAHNGSYSVELYNGTTDSTGIFLISPAVTELAANRVVFWGRHREGNLDTLALTVGLLSERYSGESFEPWQTIGLTKDYQRFVLTLPESEKGSQQRLNTGLTGGSDKSALQTPAVKFLAFKHAQETSSDNYHLDDIEWQPQPAAGEIFLYETSYSYSNTVAGAQTKHVFLIANTGTQPLQISSIDVPAPFTTSFSGTIMPGDADSIAVYFGPTVAGDFQATLTININGAFTGNNTIYLEGSAYTPYQSFNEDFEESGQMPENWSLLQRSVSGNGQIYLYSSATYANSGNYSVYMYHYFEDGDLLMLGTPGVSGYGENRLTFWARHSQQNEDRDIIVGTLTDIEDLDTFTPLDTFAVTYDYQRFLVNMPASLTDPYMAIKHGKSGNYVQMWVDDVAWTPVPEEPEVFLSDTVYTFSEVPVNGSAAFTLTIENNGRSPLEISSISVPSPFAADYSGTLQTGESADVEVRFAPTETGTFSETLTLNINGTFFGNNEVLLSGSAYAGFTEFSTDFESGAFPDGWSTLISDGNTSNRVRIYSGYANSGIYSVELFNGSPDSTGIFLITPAVANIDSNRVVFWGRHREGSNDTLDLHLGTMTDATNGATFVRMQTVRLTSDYQRFVVALETGAAITATSGPSRAFSGARQNSAPTDNAQFLAFLHGQNYQSDNYYLDDIRWEKRPAGASIFIAEEEINFPPTLLNDTTEIAVVIANDGYDDLVITSLTAPAAFASAYAGTIAPGTVDTAIVSFTPTTADDFSEVLTVNISGEFTGNNTLLVTGSGYEPLTDFAEDFENDGALPEAWSLLMETSQSGPQVSLYSSSTYARSGSYSIYFYNYADEEDILMLGTPGITGYTDHRLKFWARSNDGNRTHPMVVGTLSDLNDLQDFEPIDTVWVERDYKPFVISDFQGKTGPFIGIKHGMDANYTQLWVDDVSWESIPQDPDIVLSPESNDFPVTATNASRSFRVRIENFGINTAEITSVSVNPPFVCDFSGSIEGSGHALADVYFNPEFPGDYADTLTFNITGNFSGNNRLALTGSAYAPFAVFNEGFENGGAMPEGWFGLISNGNPSNRVQITSSYEHSGNYAVELYNGDSDSTGIFLLSPAVSGIDSNRVIFWARHRENVNDTLELHVGTTTENTTGDSFVPVETVYLTYEYQRFIVDIGDISGQRNALSHAPLIGAGEAGSSSGKKVLNYLAFKHGQNSTNDNYYIDDISWQKIPDNAEIYLSETSFEYPPTLLGKNALHIFSITNTGTQPLVISSADVSAPFDGPISTSISPGESRDYSVIFNPIEAGDASGVLTLNIDGVYTGSNTIQLSGTGYEPYQFVDEDFEEGGIIPFGWTLVNETSTSGPQVSLYSSSAYANSGSYSVYFYNYNDPEDILMAVTPGVTDFATSRLVFWARSNDAARSHQMEVVVLSDLNAPAQHGVVQTVEVERDYKRFMVRFDPGTNASYVGIKHGMDDNYEQLWIDDVAWEPIPETPEIILSDTTHTFTNTLAGLQDSMVVRIENAGLNPLVVSSVSVSEPFRCDYNGTLNLGESADVVIYFEPSVSGAFSANLTFNIEGEFLGNNEIELSGVAYAPYDAISEDFENGGSQPENWVFYKNDPNNTSAYVQIDNSSTYANSGTYSVELYNAASTTADRDLILISPAVSGLDSGQVNFWVRHRESALSTLPIQVGLWDYETQKFLPGTSIAVSNEYAFAKFAPSAHFDVDTLGSKIGLAFRHPYSNSYVNYHIDDVVWQEISVIPEVVMHVADPQFPNLAISTHYTLPITVTNLGLSQLTGTLVSSNAAFRPEHSTVDLPFFGTDTIMVSFNPAISGLSETTITLQVDGSYTGENSLDLSGEGYLPLGSFTEDFEFSTAFPYGWNPFTAAGLEGLISIRSYDGVDNSYALNMYNSSYDDPFIAVATPGLDSAASRALTFWAKSEEEDGIIQLGTTPTFGETDAFQLIKEIEINREYREYGVYLNTSDTLYYVIKHGNRDRYEDVTIDNVAWTPLPDAPLLVANRDELVFSTTYISDTTQAKSITFSNNGGGAIQVNGIAVGGTDYGDFVLTDLPAFPLQLGPFADITISVKFAPVGVGIRNARVEFDTDLPTEPASIVYLSGRSNDVNYGGGSAAEGGYFYANSTAWTAAAYPRFEWLDISASGSNLMSDFTSSSQVLGPIAFADGFSFEFFDSLVTSFYLSSEGWISFRPETNPNDYNYGIPTSSGPEQMIAWFWDDMNPVNANMTEEPAIYHGTFNDTTYVLSFVHYPGSRGYSEDWLTAQVVLYANGNIKLQYLDHGDSLRTDGMTVGIENYFGNAGVEYYHNDFGGPVFGDQMAVAFSRDSTALGRPGLGEVGDRTELFQSFPNPFGPGHTDFVTIAYDLLEDGKAKLEVFNVLGQKVATLVDEKQYANRRYVVTWDGRNIHGNVVASGVYFYRLQVNGFSKTRKMVILK
jgi:hypothetical protein